MKLAAWRIDAALHARTWATGEGARLYGGRWNPRGVPCIYAALDPATALLEVAVHKSFAALDATPHVVTRLEIDARHVRALEASDLPDADWLRPGIVGPAQQAFGAALLAAHVFVSLPSVVVPEARNLIFDPAKAAGRCRVVSQTPLVLDPRLAKSQR